MTCPRPRGFTLIELMVVVAIVGILASIAIPLGQRQLAAAKRAERMLVMRVIVPAVESWAAAGGGAAVATLTGDPHPAGVPGSVGKPWGIPAGGWGELSIGVEGSVRYQYSFTVVRDSSMIWYTSKAVGDLDQDGRQSVYIRSGKLVNGEWLRDDSVDDTYD